jgi:putative phosphoesterase
MRLAVLADVHANLPALQAVLADMQQYSLEGVVVAGDMTAGPQANETVRLLRSLPNCWMIQGNNESGLLSFHTGSAPREWYTNLQFALARWTHESLDQETWDFISALPEQRKVLLEGMQPIRVVHGSPRSISELIFPELDLVPLDLALEQIEEPVMVCGHTHLPWDLWRNGKLAINPGSVGCPLNGEVGAQYAILDWQGDHWEVSHHIVAYDLAQIEAAFRESGLLAEGGFLVRTYLASIQTGFDYSRQFLDLAYHLAEAAGSKDLKYLPDEIWEQAAATFSRILHA